MIFFVKFNTWCNLCSFNNNDVIVSINGQIKADTIVVKYISLLIDNKLLLSLHNAHIIKNCYHK